MNWWVADFLNAYGYIFVFSWLFWVVLAITLHELGHGVAAIWQGDETPIETGHMTMNPMVHMGMMSLAALLIIGLAWGAMPVNPYRFRMGRLGDALVSAAGPAVNLLLAFFALTTLAIVGVYAPSTNFVDNFTTFLWVGGLLNLALLVLNLLPVPPLDGSRILAGLFDPAARFFDQPEVRQYGIFGLLLILFLGGRHIFGASVAVGNWWLGLVMGILP